MSSNSQREPICTVQNQKKKKQPTPRKRPEALSSRHTQQPVSFWSPPCFSFACVLLVPLWCHCANRLTTNEHLRLFLNANIDRPLVLRIHTHGFAKTKTTLHKTIHHHWLTAPILFANHFLMTKVLW